MPKVYLTAKQIESAKAESGDDALRVLVATRMKRDRLTQKTIAERINVTPITLPRWLNAPEKMTLKMLRRLGNELGFSDSEFRSCVTGGKSAT